MNRMACSDHDNAIDNDSNIYPRHRLGWPKAPGPQLVLMTTHVLMTTYLRAHGMEIEFRMAHCNGSSARRRHQLATVKCESH